MVKITIATKQVELTERLEKYVNNKIGNLEKYLPRTARDSAHAEVRLGLVTSKGAHQHTCEITLHLPHENLQISETTQNLFAAVDVTTAHLREQIKTYKVKHMPSSIRHRLARRFRADET